MTPELKQTIFGLVRNTTCFNLNIPYIKLNVIYAEAKNGHIFSVSGKHFDRMKSKESVIEKLKEIL